MIPRRSILLSSTPSILGHVEVSHHDEARAGAVERARWHLRERWILGTVHRTVLPCDCVACSSDALLPGPRVRRLTP